MKRRFLVNYRQLVTASVVLILSLVLLATGCVLLSAQLHKTVEQGLTGIMTLHVCEVYLTLSNFINCRVAKAHHLAILSLVAGGITMLSLTIIFIGEVVHAAS